jgi:hypothetical protein
MKHFLSHRRVEIKNIALEIVNDALLTFIEKRANDDGLKNGNPSGESIPNDNIQSRKTKQEDKDFERKCDGQAKYIVSDEGKLLPIIHNLWAPFSYRYGIFHCCCCCCCCLLLLGLFLFIIYSISFML